MMRELDSSPLPSHPFEKRPVDLDPFSTRTVLAVSSACGRRYRVPGPLQQRLAKSLLNCSEKDPIEVRRRLFNLLDKLEPPMSLPLPGRNRWRKHFDRAWREAEHLQKSGLRVARLPQGRTAPGKPSSPCGLVCYRGRAFERSPYVALFNSRKPKRLAENTPWLEALRRVVKVLSRGRLTWVSSIGTLTYDLLTAHALRCRQPIVIVLPLSPSAAPANHPQVPDPKRIENVSLLSCVVHERSCPRSTRMVCRDALIAALTDLHVILDVRTGGNLERVLCQQRHRRTLWFLGSTANGERKSRLRDLCADSAVSCHRFRETHRADHQQGSPDIKNRIDTGALTTIPESGYLYHYTRSCPGPWPGQSLPDYLEAILDARQGWTHGALDTLIRILSEGCLRGGSRMIRGAAPTVSWTALSPVHISRLRKWRRGLARWTLEPYGIAVRRKVLRGLGAAPAIYLSPQGFDRLRAADRYRYQRHEPPRCDWKYEREWRFKGNLELGRIGPRDAFIFVATMDDALHLRQRVEPGFPVAVLANP